MSHSEGFSFFGVFGKLIPASFSQLTFAVTPDFQKVAPFSFFIVAFQRHFACATDKLQRIHAHRIERLQAAFA
jgi:hypothetical protein